MYHLFVQVVNDLLSTKPNSIRTHFCSWIHLRRIQVDWYIRCYRWQRCLLHTRRYLRHHRATRITERNSWSELRQVQYVVQENIIVYNRK